MITRGTNWYRSLTDTQKNRILWGIYALAAVVVSGQKLLNSPFPSGYTAYENYVIFKNSFSHLVQGQNPYAAFPAEQWDLYKYSPAFALAMAPFAFLPDGLGLPVWNLLNAGLLLAAVLRLPVLDGAQRRFLAWFILPELVISLQNSQSNGLTAAFLLWAFVALEQEKPAWGAAWTAAGAFLKIFGIFAAAPALVYPWRRRYIAALVGFAAFLALVPLLVLSPSALWQVYGWWWDLLRQDHSASIGLSVLGWLRTWLGWDAPKWAVTLAGGLVLLACVGAVYQRNSAERRVLLWASVLLWVVIFNHKAESPTFVIALCGAALWYLAYPHPPVWKRALFWTAFALASLSPTDIFPRALREHVVQPYVLKAVPCIAIWIILSWRLLLSGREMPGQSQATPT